MELFDEIYAESTLKVKAIFEGENAHHLTYHNWQHTLKVVQSVQEIAESIQEISETQKKCLVLAALFHDSGYPQGRDGHEAKGVEIAGEFLTEKGLQSNELELIEKYILVTQMGVEPTDVCEMTMKDADLFHLGQENYVDGPYSNLFNEIKTYFTPELPENEWCTMCVEFMQKHKYFTPFAKENYGPQKKINIDILLKMEEDNLTAKDTDSSKPKKKKKNKKNNSEIPEKGIETMFRVALRNHVSLSRIADNKANTLISVNA
ncbi:MAG: HD domain-containing protein, partial [Flavobacteriales bacterium]